MFCLLDEKPSEQVILFSVVSGFIRGERNTDSLKNKRDTNTLTQTKETHLCRLQKNSCCVLQDDEISELIVSHGHIMRPGAVFTKLFYTSLQCQIGLNRLLDQSIAIQTISEKKDPETSSGCSGRKKQHNKVNLLSLFVVSFLQQTLSFSNLAHTLSEQ